MQRLMNTIIPVLEGCECYVDDAIICSDSCEEHVNISEACFKSDSEAKLTISLVESEVCHTTVEYLGRVVGQIKTANGQGGSYFEFSETYKQKGVNKIFGHGRILEFFY